MVLQITKVKKFQHRNRNQSLIRCRLESYYFEIVSNIRLIVFKNTSSCPLHESEKINTIKKNLPLLPRERKKERKKKKKKQIW
jgi:hypothetical protein